MAIDLIKNTLKYTIFLGLIGLFIGWAFGLQNTFAETRIINGQEILVFSWNKYITSLSNAWYTNALNFDDILPTRVWDDSGTWYNWEPMFNNIALLFDWLYFPINFLLYITRWMTWIFRLAFALIGWDFSMVNGEYNSVIIKILTWITQNMFIPYI